MWVQFQNAAQQPQEECSGALPPVCGEACSEVANPIMVQDIGNTEQKQAMFTELHLDLLMRRFKIKACPHKGRMRVLGEEC